MFTPDPMRHLVVAVLLPDLDAAIHAVVLAGDVHPLEVHHVAAPDSPVHPYDVADTLVRLDAILRTLAAVEQVLGASSSAPPAPPGDGAPFDLDAAEALARQLSALADGFRDRAAALAERAAQLQGILRTVRALEPLGVPLDDLRTLRYATLTSGFLPARNLQRLRDSLAETPHVVLTGGRPADDGRTLVTALCLRRDAAVLERALRSAQFDALPLPTHLQGTPGTATAALEREVAAQRDDVTALEAECTRCGRQRSAELTALRAAVGWQRVQVEARGRFGHSEHLAVLNGWVPTRRTAALEAALRRNTADRCLVRWDEPADVEGVRRGHIVVPVLLRNPPLLRPFEALLRNYGLPRYGEIEPTPIVALGFLTMFGFMFGDVGQGLVLAGFGALLYRRTVAQRDYAVLLMECGAFATLFGFLYGSIFGSEAWLPALWLRPLEHTDRLMISAVAFGIGFLTLGLSLNMLNAVRQREWAALWERNGLLAAWVYWAAVGLAVRAYISGPDAVAFGTALLWLAPPLGLILLKEPARAIRAARRDGRRLGADDLFALAVESLVEVLDTAVSTLSNTATFIRLAAFALSHAGLFLATFSVADAVAAGGGMAGTLGALCVLVLGNLVIIALEGLIVAIQSVRLEYYEFFSKFYTGDGLEYRPLRCDPAAPARP